ncbi:MAG: beta-mannanase [Thermomicrobia bacterium]|nr:beta-mannanase [Thermomicrobia bacterium]
MVCRQDGLVRVSFLKRLGWGERLRPQITSHLRFVPLICWLLAVALQTVDVTAAPAHTLALGAYIANAPGDPSRIDTFTGMVGGAPGIVMWYQDWVSAGNSAFDPIKMNAVVTRGAMPMITWEPWDAAAGANQPAYSLRAITDGAHDAFIHQWARDAAAWGKPLYLKFAHEMNGDWYPWAANTNGNTAAQYGTMWKHVRAIFRQEGAINVRWVWSPNVAYPSSASFAQVYPGDTAVDWVGLDGYNFGTSQSWSQWTDFVGVFSASYDSLAQMTRKPMLIGETASSELGGNKAAWITQGLLTDVPNRFPRLRAIIWFDESKETDWRVNSSSASLTAFRTVVSSPTYHGHLP